MALTYNDCGNFRDDWVTVRANPASPCVFTRGIDLAQFPIRHGEGKFYAEKDIIDRLWADEQVVLRYTLPDGDPAEGRFPFNPNGSVDDIAGICDPTGRIFGLMPHPEAFNHWTNHPRWTRSKEERKRQGLEPETDPTAGVQILQNGVRYIKEGF